MKRNFFKIMSLILMVVVCVFALVACNPGDGEDKSFNNSDFVSFRKKIVTILKDNGIYVNDIDAQNKKTASADSDAKFTLLLGTAKAQAQNSIEDILAKPEYSANNEDFAFAIKQIFGMSLKMSLCLGDGISNYYGETSFYDIAVNINGSYMSVSENGDTNTVRAFYPSRADYNVEQFEQIDVKFTSDTNYSFRSLSIQESNEQGLGSSRMYASGNAQKQLIVVQLNDNGETGQAIYSPNGTSVYSTEDIDVVNACLATLENDVFNVEKDKFYANRTNVKYTFTAEQSQALTDKYFKDIQSSTAEIRGLVYRTVGGIKFADNYRAADYEQTVEITTGTEYISDSFAVYDKHNTVKSLYIPKSVKGVVQLQDPKTGEEYATPKILTSGLTARTLNIALVREEETTESIFNRIDVENGSPLFKSGSGHLYTKSNNLIYIANTPMDDIDFDSIDESVITLLDKCLEFGAKKFYLKTEEVNIDLSKDYTIDENAGWGLREIWKAVAPFYTNLKNFNIVGKFNGEPISLDFFICSNLTLNINIANTWEWHESGANLSLESDDQKQHNVTVNLKGLTRLDGVGASENIKVTVNSEAPEMLYLTTDRIVKPESHDNITYKFAVPSSITQEQMENFSFKVRNTSDSAEIIAEFINEKGVDGPVIIPEKFMFDVTALELSYSDKYTVILNSKIKTVIMNINSYQLPTLAYDGTLEEFKNKVTVEGKNDDYAFILKDKDGNTHLIRGKNAPEFYNISYDIAGVRGSDVVRQGSSYYWEIADLNLDTAHYIYYIADNFGGGTYVNPLMDTVGMEPKHDNTHYTLVRFELVPNTNPNADPDSYLTSYTFEYLEIDLEIRIATQIMHYDTHDEVRTKIYANGYKDDYTLTVTGEANNLLGEFATFTLTIMHQTDSESYSEYATVKLNWSWNENGDLTLDGITEIIPEDDPKKE